MKRLARHAEIDADAARIGDDLRMSRLALGLTVEELASSLRIRRTYLDALEEGRLRDLPAPAYAVGYVRSYAAALGLDADSMARRFRDATGAAATRPNLVFPEPVPERGMPTATLAGIGAVVAVCSYVAWFNLSGGGARIVDAVPPVPPRLEQAAERGRAQLPGSEAAPRQEAGALPLAALPPPGGLPPVGANTSAQAATVPLASRVAVVTDAPPSPPEAAAPAAEPAPPAPPGITLRARAASPEGAWVHVRDPRSGQVLVNRVLRPGESWAVPVRDGLVLDTGKADALEILMDGQPQPTLEGLVGVRRNIALEPDRLRQRLAPATASATQAGATRN